jgi:hypothetical protein
VALVDLHFTVRSLDLAGFWWGFIDRRTTIHG